MEVKGYHRPSMDSECENLFCVPFRFIYSKLSSFVSSTYSSVFSTFHETEQDQYFSLEPLNTTTTNQTTSTQLNYTRHQISAQVPEQPQQVHSASANNTGTEYSTKEEQRSHQDQFHDLEGTIEDEQEEQECLVCYELVTKTNPGVLSICKCGMNKHSYHLHCLLTWRSYSQQSSCPVCATEIFFQPQQVRGNQGTSSASVEETCPTDRRSSDPNGSNL